MTLLKSATGSRYIMHTSSRSSLCLLPTTSITLTTFYSNIPDEKGSLGPTAAPPHSYPQGWLVPLLSLVLVYDTRMLRTNEQGVSFVRY